jgi:hypothetical protein
MAEQPILIGSKPGCKRDGTRFEGDNYIDVQWCRFQRGKPRKIGGFQLVTDTVPEIARGMTSFSQDNTQYLHIGHPNTVGQYQVSGGTLVAFSDRTPAAFVTSVGNLWQFAIFADTSGAAQTLLVAHAAQNVANIDNSIGANIYIGVVTAAAVLTVVGLNAAWNTNPVSGGICVSGQYLFTFGSNGVIRQSQINDLTLLPVEFNIGTQKIVAGMALRGSGTGPGVLFWALNALIRGTFQAGGPPDFAFDIIAGDTSILSSQGVVEYDGIYYWPGVDRWLMFNGVLREIPNNMNQNWFFDNLNFAQRQKVFGIKIPRYGEIWWCYPRGTATECTHAIIYNVRENSWYDTELPDSNGVTPGRTAGVFADVYELPFMVDNVVTGTGRSLWQHEVGYDKSSGASATAIQSYFETHELSMLEQGQSSKSMHVGRVEPDFVQAGDMTMQVSGRANAKAPVTLGPIKTFPAVPTDPTDETIKVKEIRRLMSFRFESNVAGGNYEYGDTYAHVEPADGRIES